MYSDRRWQERSVAPWLEDSPGLVDVCDRVWYMRTFTMPRETAGRKVVLTFTMLNTRDVVYVDGERAAEATFPGGEADITKFVKPGRKQTLTLDVTAYPLSAETLTFNAPDRADTKAARVKFKGVTGDLYLDAYRADVPRIADATVECDVKGGRARFVAEIEGFESRSTPLKLVAKVRGAFAGAAPHDFESGPLTPDAEGRLAFDAEWRDAALWDSHTPQNLYACMMELCDADGRVLDVALPFRFGFRDVRICGRDLLLNGVPLHLRALHNHTMNAAAGIACAESARELIRRLKSEGFNFVIAGNYNFSPGEVSYMDALLDECDRSGMLFSYSLPHCRDFSPKKVPKGMHAMEMPENAARYREMAKWAIRRARNHPCVIAYAMNHNAAGYVGDMNPMRIDGRYEPQREEAVRETWWAARNRRNAHIAWEIAKSMDATRPAYHHESGNLDEFHTSNIYLNWAPVQERSDWLQHWSETGVKPLFFVEWGAPHISSWSSYRGPLFIHSNPVFQSLWASEFAAAFRGDAAYEGDSGWTVKALGREEKLWAEGKPFYWHRLHCLLKDCEGNYQGIVERYLSDNWRSHRAWGITAMLPWDQGNFHTAGSKTVRANPKRWERLKQPGIVTDYFTDESWDSGTGNAAAYRQTRAGKAIARWNGEDCAFIGGDEVFTDKSHHFRPGGTVKKTLVILNDRRVDQTVVWECSLRETGETRRGSLRIPAGTRRDAPVAFTLPNGRAGRFTLAAKFTFEGGSVQTDEFSLEAYASAATADVPGLALYDPKGLTAKEFDRLGIKYETAAAQLDSAPCIVVGRECLTRELLGRLVVPAAKSGQRVLVFEQTKETLDALGFRAQTHGLRDVFPRSRAARGELALDESALRDWNGESTIAPPYLENIMSNEVKYARDIWAGFSNSRVWRCRNRGCVATAIPEKPTVGDWTALVDGGFDLQYAPLLEWRVGAGSVTFCQLDVTARTANDPVADDIVNRLVARLGAVSQSRPTAGMVFRSGAAMPEGFFDRISRGAKALCLGFSKDEVAKWSPVTLAMAHTNGCYASRIEKIPPELDGLSNADWQWHGAMAFDAFTERTEDGNAAIRIVRHGRGAIVFWQVPPDAIDEKAKPYLRTSKRRAQWMLSRLSSNIGAPTDEASIRYADKPEADDDPYRYYRW